MTFMTAEFSIWIVLVELTGPKSDLGLIYLVIYLHASRIAGIAAPVTASKIPLPFVTP
jgi:hypothetical protein